MMDEAEIIEYEKRLKKAYKLYDKRYPDLVRELNYAEQNTKSGYLNENNALYYMWLFDKAKKYIFRTHNAVTAISNSIEEPPRSEAESWGNDAKRECIKIINEYLGGRA